MEDGDLNRMVWEGFSEEATLMNKGLKDGGEGAHLSFSLKGTASAKALRWAIQVR